MLAYSLNKNLDGQKILQDMQSLVSKYNTKDNNFVLVIQVKEVVVDNNSFIPKIEYKPEETL
jgi:hypothetical protein